MALAHPLPNRLRGRRASFARKMIGAEKYYLLFCSLPWNSNVDIRCAQVSRGHFVFIVYHWLHYLLTRLS